jgi:hypothetical protein
MEAVLRGYSLNDASWFYLSLPLIAAVFFRFNRVWSLRNFDLLLLLSMSPALLLVRAEATRAVGYAWLFTGTGLLLLRLFSDSLFKRRPRCEENLNSAGMAFLCVVAFGFLTTKVITTPPPVASVEAVGRANDLLERKSPGAGSNAESEGGPAATLLTAPFVPISKAVRFENYRQVAVCIMAVMAHLSVVVGLAYFGARHMGDLRTGMAMATLYLLLPCTAYDVARADHVLPAAFIIWALVAYRHPKAAGCLMGLACGTMFFPLFLLPLWIVFYWRKDAFRFLGAFAAVSAILIGSVLLTSHNLQSFLEQTVGSIDWTVLAFRGRSGTGFWESHHGIYRLPLMAAFVVMVLVLTIWPRRKNIEHLLASSTAIIVATQLWYPRNGGAYLLWYLPLMLVVVFRPRLAQLLPPNGQTSDDKSRPALEPSQARTERALTTSTTTRFFR